MKKKIMTGCLGLGSICCAVFGADMYYDSDVSERAAQKCEAAGVKFVNTKGLFNTKIRCNATV